MPDGIGQAQLIGQREHRVDVRTGHRRTHQMEPGFGVVPSPIEPEGLDQMVLGLVGRDPPDEEEHRPRSVRGRRFDELVPADRSGPGLSCGDEDRHHRRGRTAEPPEFGGVERRVGDSEGGRGRQLGRLVPGQRHLLAVWSSHPS